MLPQSPGHISFNMTRANLLSLDKLLKEIQGASVQPSNIDEGYCEYSNLEFSIKMKLEDVFALTSNN